MNRVLITGAARGIGLAFVRNFLARGDRVLALRRRADAGGALVDLAKHQAERLTLLTLDLADLDAIPALEGLVRAHVDALDVVVNNAGVLKSGERFGSVAGADLTEAFRINAAAPLLVTQALTPLLARGNAPRVLNVSTELASIARRSAFATPSYSISKAALNMATRLMAFELGARGIACAAVHPGWVKTDMGGPNAPLPVEDSVRALIGFIDRMKIADNGGYFNADGTPLPW
jgi:NAD(P)-dependent dehydrogenase (short-subunit alcohol dehydrogenase family)